MGFIKGIGIFMLMFLCLMILAFLVKIISFKMHKYIHGNYNRDVVVLKKIHELDTWGLAAVFFGAIVFIYGFFYMK